MLGGWQWYFWPLLVIQLVLLRLRATVWGSKASIPNAGKSTSYRYRIQYPSHQTGQDKRDIQMHLALSISRHLQLMGKAMLQKKEDAMENSQIEIEGLVQDGYWWKLGYQWCMRIHQNKSCDLTGWSSGHTIRLMTQEQELSLWMALLHIIPNFRPCFCATQQILQAFNLPR